jgi:NAD(P)-dependent dehydrogenase (short-subunit alcohol dehydrogenase family)
MNNNKVAIITGSTDGIGRATACLLAHSGISVVLNGRHEEKLATTMAAIKADGGTCLSVKGDITEQKVRDELITKTMDHFGRIDILVNNAGGSTHSLPFLEITDSDWDKTILLNLNYSFRLIQSVIPVMKTAGGGKIVNVSSFAGRQRSLLSGADYAAAKAGLIGLTRQLAYELGPIGIHVNSVAPGITITDRVDKKWQLKSTEEQQSVLNNIPLRRAGTPQDVAGPIAFLVSDAANYITGATIDVNGGAFMG